MQPQRFFTPLLLPLLAPAMLGAQAVAINTDASNPDPSALLDVKSTEKGMLVPRMASYQRTAIATPATGLLVFDTGTGSFWFFNGTAWVNLVAPAVLTDADGDTKIQVEASPDEDVIRMDLAGSEGLVLQRNAAGSTLIGLPGNGQNIFIGNAAGSSNTSGTANTAAGEEALFSNTTGSNNSAVGYQALYSNLGASFNTGQGYQALYSNTAGGGNTAVGVQALFSNTSGGSNTALGLTALSGNTDGNRNTAAGLEALSFNTTGSDNTALGMDALVFNRTGYSNTATGKDALLNNFSGFHNTATGILALKDNVNGIYNTSIGSTSYFTVGSLSNTTSLGYFSGGISNVSNRIEIGNLSVSWIGGQVGWSTFSDARIKTQVQENVPGVAFIAKLRPVTYHLDIHRQNELCFKGKKVPGVWEGMYDIEQKPFTGFIAQEVAAAARAVGYDFSGVEQAADEVGLYSVRYSDFVAPLVKAVQEQQAQIEQLNAENTALKTRLDTQEALLRKIVAAMEARGER